MEKQWKANKNWKAVNKKSAELIAGQCYWTDWQTSKIVKTSKCDTSKFIKDAKKYINVHIILYIN